MIECGNSFIYFKFDLFTSKPLSYVRGSFWKFEVCLKKVPQLKSKLV